MTTQEQVIEKITSLLNEFIKDWGLDEEIIPETKFNDDLCFSSVDMLHYLAIVDMNFKAKYPFDQLIMIEGSYRKELTVAELADFVFENRNIGTQEPKAL